MGHRKTMANWSKVVPPIIKGSAGHRRVIQQWIGWREHLQETSGKPMNQPNESMLGSRWSPQIVETTRHHHFLLRSNKHNECSHSDAEEHASILARRMRGNSCSSKTWVKLRSHAISSEGNFTGYIMIHHEISPKNREIHRKAMVSMTIKYIIGSFCNQSSDLMQKKMDPKKSLAWPSFAQSISP